MPIDVTMPDGSVQKFPSRKSLVVKVEVGGAPKLADQPVANLNWRFWTTGDGWRAVRR